MIQKNIHLLVSTSQLLSDSLHLTDFINFTADAAIISVGEHLKENAADLPAFPEVFSSDAKVEKLIIIAFPLVLPIIKGFVIPEGEIEEDNIYEKIDKIHDFYAD